MFQLLSSPEFKAGLELAYYASGCLVAVFAAIGLYQLVLTKRIARISSQREAFRIAAAQCEVFANQILPFASQVHDAIEKAKITVGSKAKVEWNDEGVSVDLSKVDKKDIEKLKALDVGPSDLLNRLEAYAVFFLTRVADERPGFLSTGCAYCDMVEEMLPYIALLSNDDPTYEHVMGLYAIWKEKREHLKLSQDRERIEQKLGQTKPIAIKAIGT